MQQKKTLIAFGPEMPGIGSWEWIGADMRKELSPYYRTVGFGEQIPHCDVAVIVKYRPSAEMIARVARNSKVIFCPVDYYGNSAEIDRDGPLLRCCARVLVHCRRLRKYFQSYAPVESIDHHVKYASPPTQEQITNGHGLWVGMKTNLPPLVEWVNRHRLPGELRVLTNIEEPTSKKASSFGFNATNRVRIEAWSAQCQATEMATARWAIDVKGDDFRQRHKPPTKAVDYLASGLPLAMNGDSSCTEELALQGFQVADLEDQDRWLSDEYREETLRFGARLRNQLSRRQVGLRFKRIIDEVLAERRTV